MHGRPAVEDKRKWEMGDRTFEELKIRKMFREKNGDRERVKRVNGERH